MIHRSLVSGNDLQYSVHLAGSQTESSLGMNRLPDHFLSGESEIFQKIVKLYPGILVLSGNPFKNFSRFTLLGRQTQALICTLCNAIDANFGSTTTINLAEYDAHLHRCSSLERQNYEGKV